MQSQKIYIWVSSKAVRVSMKSSYHKPQSSRTRQARLESAFNKMLWGRRASGTAEKKVMRLTMVAEKIWNQYESKQVLQHGTESYQSFTLIYCIKATYPTSEMRLSQDVSHSLPFSKKRCHLLRFLKLLLNTPPVLCQLSTWLLCQSSKHLMQWFLWKYFNNPKDAVLQDVQLYSSFHSTKIIATVLFFKAVDDNIKRILCIIK